MRKDFAELTVRGRARRLRRMAFAALEHYELDVTRVRLINNSFNCIFRVDTAAGEKYILRVNLPDGRTLDEIRSEMTWLAALRRDTGLGVPKPLATRTGALVTTVEAEGVPEPRHCVVFGWITGPDLAERLSEDNMVKLGALAARLHQHADGFVPPAGFWLKTYEKVFPFHEPVLLFDRAYRDLFPPQRREVYRRALERVQVAIDKLNADRGQLRVIHADLHQWNVKTYRGKLYALDFDDCMYGYPVQDIATTLYYFQDPAYASVYRAAFQRGYTRYRDWPEQYPGEIDTFMAGRALVLVNYVLYEDKPEYREMAPEYVERIERRLRACLDGGEGR